MLLKTFSFGTQIRTFINSNDFLQIKLIPVHSGPLRCHSGVIPIHNMHPTLHSFGARNMFL